jgi:hypothetical protein
VKIALFSLLLCAMTGTASAITIASVDRNPASVTQSQPAVTPEAQFERACVRQSGSHLAAAQGQSAPARCVTSDGRSFSQEDFARALKATSAGH